MKTLAKAKDPKGQEKYVQAYMEKFKDEPSLKVWQTDWMKSALKANPRVFLSFAKGLEDKFGVAEGRKFVRELRVKAATEMGKAIAERVRARGGRLNLNNLFDEFWKDFGWIRLFDLEKTFDEEGNIIKYVLRIPCHAGDYLKENAPDPEFSENYFIQDVAAAQAYNPNIRYTRLKYAPAGDLYCELIWELNSKDIL